MRDTLGVGLGRSGIGENFAKSRLLLAKRAGYLPANTRLSQTEGGAADLWHMFSKNLSGDAKQAGFQNPMMFLRAGAQAGGKLPGRKQMPVMPTQNLVNANSAQASMRIADPMMNVNPLLRLLMQQRMTGSR